MAFSANKVLGMSPVHTVLVHVYTTDTYSFTVKGNLVASKNDIHIRTGPEMLLLETHSRNPHTWPQTHTPQCSPARCNGEGRDNCPHARQHRSGHTDVDVPHRTALRSRGELLCLGTRCYDLDNTVC